ncbi:NHL repeat-containing protein [candidate division KSB1 bacterium]
MRRLQISLIFMLITFFRCSGEPDTYTVEIIDGVRHMHNFAPLWGDEPGIKLEFVQKIGELEGDDENYQLFTPLDLAVDKDGKIYILDVGNCRVQKYDKDGKYIATIGRRGQGPGEFNSVNAIFLDNESNIYVADYSENVIHILTNEGRYLNRIRTGAYFFNPYFDENSGLKYFVTHRRLDSERPFIEIFDQDQNLVAGFGERKELKYIDSPAFQSNFNHFSPVTDKNGNIYITFDYQNRIEKFSPVGEMLLKISRELGFEESEDVEKIPYTREDGRQSNFSKANEFSSAIQVDGKGRIWLRTKIKQYDLDNYLNRDNLKETFFKFEVFDPEGVLLGYIDNEHLNQGYFFKIFDDRLFIINPSIEMAVFEYRIVEKQ